MVQEIKNMMAEAGHRPVAYYPAFARLAGSINAGVLLSQLLYWHGAMGNREFYKTDIEISAETNLSEKELRSAKARVRALGFVRTIVRGMPPVTYYDFDLQELAESLARLITPKGRIQYRQKGVIDSAERAELIPPKGRKQLRQKGGNNSAERAEHITENTTKTTHKTTAEITLPETTKKIPLTTKKDKEKTYKTPAARPGLEVLQDEAFILEMEEWTQGIVNVRYEMEKMCDWLSQGGKRYKDYKAFCRNWLRRACERVHADWKRQQPKQVALDKREVDDVLRYIQDRDEYNRSMGLV